MKQLLLVIMAVFVLGCGTYNWVPYYGVYTYDDALTEFGTPVSSSKLTTGGLTASWLMDHSDSEIKVLERVLTFDEKGLLVKGSSPGR